MWHLCILRSIECIANRIKNAVSQCHVSAMQLNHGSNELIQDIASVIWNQPQNRKYCKVSFKRIHIRDKNNVTTIITKYCWSCSRCRPPNVSTIGLHVCGKATYCADHYLIILSRFNFPWLCRLGAFFVHRLFRYRICRCHFFYTCEYHTMYFAWFKIRTRTDFATWRVLITITARYTFAF